MSTQADEHPSGIEAQILSLRKMVWVAIGLALAALVVVSVDARRMGRTTIEAEEFAVRDENGALRARLTFQGLSLVDKDGRLRVGINMGALGVPSLVFVGKDGQLRAGLSMGTDDTSAFNLYDSAGRLRTSMTVGSDDMSNLIFYDQTRREVARIPGPSGNQATLAAPAPPTPRGEATERSGAKEPHRPRPRPSSRGTRGQSHS